MSDISTMPSSASIAATAPGSNTGNYAYSTPTALKFYLEVVQQPIRARMCGFGDKDRRQITPPPCVRLHVANAATGLPIEDISSIDVSSYALLVELWSPDEQVNMSLVNPSGQVHLQESSTTATTVLPSGSIQQRTVPPTRNLIGSLVATAFKLYDLSENLGIWFVLQDLSVRTEGEYRLKFLFVNLAETFDSIGTTAPIICTAFSKPFRSFSAKKFPGVIDSTELSRCFAVQGIKIPIRRDHKGKIDKSEDH